MIDFRPVLRKARKSGTGCITQINDHLFEGRYSPVRPGGTWHSKQDPEGVREETEGPHPGDAGGAAGASEPGAGITPLDKLTKPQEKIWMYMKVHPDVTNYWAIVRGVGVTRHTAPSGMR